MDKYESDEDSKVEFILAVDDLESVVSFRANQEKHTYKMGEKVGDKMDYQSASTRLSDLFEPKGNTSTIDKEDLESMKIEMNLETLLRRVSGKFKAKVTDEYFSKLTKELHKLARLYNKKMDEIHMLFMEVCCDLEDLKKLLKGE